MNEFFLWLESLTFWHWMVLGAVLVIVELLAPGVWFLWLGLGAMATGTVVLFADQISWQYQLVLFGGLSIVSVIIGRLVMRRGQPAADHPMLNRRAQQYVGQVFTLLEPTENGHGRVRVGDSVWRVSLSSPDEELPAGTRVTVTDVDGATLKVEPVGSD